ncbi:MAG: inosine/xanthosine triphosphatase, partial [Candidatus Moraniibacteriota bacterium]
MKILIASKNPVKQSAVEIGFQKMFPDMVCEYISIAADSSVKDQPDTDEETITGARNRVAHLKKMDADAEYYVAIEGGVDRIYDKMFAFAWVVVEDKQGKIGEARTVTFEIPPKVALLIEEGVELGIANDQVFGTENSKHKNGAIGILTNDIMTRTSEYVDAVVLALVPFQKHKDLY